ncbi:MAG: hypothetical protein ABH872_00845 [Candidatus Omnitrophota bacterium]
MKISIPSVLVSVCIVAAVTCGFVPVLPAETTQKIVYIDKLEEGGYSLVVHGKPFLAKGVIYRPTPVGKGHDYDFFSDPLKPWLVDGKLMKEMGLNCVRIYSAGKDFSKAKEFISDMYDNFGIYTVVSDWLGLWSYPEANYADKDFQEKTKKELLAVIEGLKDEKGLLMWILGNENNLTCSGQIRFWTSPEVEKIKKHGDRVFKKAEIYYSFVNELALEVKKIDPGHPVALGNGEVHFLDVAAEVCENVDVLAIITYRGKTFNNLFSDVSKIFDRPVFLSEFGCDSYDAYKLKEDQEIQAQYLLSQWKNLYDNTVMSGNAGGNAIGGVVFEWNDEWWKYNEGYEEEWSIHNTQAGWSQGTYSYDIKAENNLNMNEEWFGLVSIKETLKDGINERVPKKSYYALKNLFKTIKNNVGTGEPSGPVISK